MNDKAGTLRYYTGTLNYPDFYIYNLHNILSLLSFHNPVNDLPQMTSIFKYLIRILLNESRFTYFFQIRVALTLSRTATSSFFLLFELS
ncbi:hypothetical protein [Lacrimispora sp.]|uniref:hypothetical protein n=1 Tax=Lacrimispora sp. TaxID=2719234 RepID=UPI0028A60E5C|nr:hypothetical protein [Lacrimispora sp.]